MEHTQLQEKLFKSNCLFSDFGSCYIRCFSCWVGNTLLFYTPPTDCCSLKSEHIFGSWLSGIHVWHEIQIYVTNWNWIWTFIGQHIISSFSQVLENMFHCGLMFWSKIRLIFADHAHCITWSTNIWSSAKYSIH